MKLNKSVWGISLLSLIKSIIIIGILTLVLWYGVKFEIGNVGDWIHLKIQTLPLNRFF